KPWHEELPPAGAEDWGGRASRRQKRAVYRLAFVPTKYRIGEEPEPLIYEVDHTTEPWQMRDVTADVISQGDAAQEQQRRDAAERIDKAIESLISETQSQELSKTKAEAFLMSKGMTRQTARELIERQAGRHWKLAKNGKAF